MRFDIPERQPKSVGEDRFDLLHRRCPHAGSSAVEGNEATAGDERRELAGLGDRHPAVVASVENQGRHRKVPSDLADVDPGIGRHESLRVLGGGRAPLQLGEDIPEVESSPGDELRREEVTVGRVIASPTDDRHVGLQLRFGALGIGSGPRYRPCA